LTYRKADTLPAAAILALLLALVPLGIACDSTQAPIADGHTVTSEYDAKTATLQRLASDSKRDGRIDTWAYMDGTRLIRIEADENGDGRVDRWEYYPSEAAVAKNGSRPLQAPERVERSTRFDGKVSRWEYFEQGALVRVEEDTDGDGNIDKWETYKDGSLAEMALDTDHLGKPGRRLIYKSDGSLDHIETPH
jgi:hypothetical protein